MTTRILREFAFQAGVYFEEEFSMNMYGVSLGMEIQTDSIREQNIAMERLKYYFANSLESGIFVNRDEAELIEKYSACGLRVCEIPGDPYDQLITIMLLVKLNAIAEGRLIITDITLGSELSDGVNFIYDLECPLGPFEELGWWIDPTPNIADIPNFASKKDKVVKLIDLSTTSWAVADLLWKDKADPSEPNEIKFNSDK